MPLYNRIDEDGETVTVKIASNDWLYSFGFPIDITKGYGYVEILDESDNVKGYINIRDENHCDLITDVPPGSGTLPDNG